MSERRWKRSRRQAFQLVIGAISWVGLAAIVWHLTKQDPPPRAIYGLEYLGVDTVLIFFFVLTFGAWRLVKVASRRRTAKAPMVEVPLAVDVLGRRVQADSDVWGAQVVRVTFDDEEKRYGDAHDV